jgi:HSP20 family protein
MTLIKFKNGSPVMAGTRMPYFNDLFNDFFENVVNSDIRKGNVPQVNIRETDTGYHLEMAAPGLNKEDFKISIENEVLTVSGEKKSETSEKSGKYSRKEFSYNSFMRSFTLPEVVDTEKIMAKYENGIMMVDLPKKEEAKPKTPREVQIV